MLNWIVRLAVAVAALCALSVAPAGAAPEPADCQNDSKLIGRIELSTADAPGTWWRLTKDGFDAAGVTDYKAMMEGWFGTTFASLDDAVEALVAAVVPLDRNGNGFVCASAPRGTRTVVGDPNYGFYYFSVIDDKHVK